MCAIACLTALVLAGSIGAEPVVQNPFAQGPATRGPAPWARAARGASGQEPVSGERAPASSREGVERLARSLVVAAYRGTPEVFHRLYDPASLRARALEGLGEDRVLPTEKVLAALDPWRDVSGVIEAGGDFNFIGAREADGAVLGLFRLTVLLEFDYHQYRFEPRGESGLAIVDAHLFSRGELLSETLGRYLSLSKRGRTILATMGEHLAAGRVAEGLSLVDELPKALRTGRDFLALKAALAGLDSTENWKRAIAEYDRVHPGQTELDYLRLSYGLDHDPPELTEEALVHLEAHTGDRAFAEYFRGNLTSRTGQWEAARRHYAQALTLQPSYEDPLWDLLQVYEATGDYHSFGAVLERLEARFEYSFESIEEDGAYAGFVASPVFPQWQARRAAAREGNGGGEGGRR